MEFKRLFIEPNISRAQITYFIIIILSFFILILFVSCATEAMMMMVQIKWGPHPNFFFFFSERYTTVFFPEKSTSACFNLIFP